MELLKRIETPTCPFAQVEDPHGQRTRAHWVRPVLVAQVRYTEITDDGRLRHPTYLGLRDDKAAAEGQVPKVPRGVHEVSAGAFQQTAPKLAQRRARAKAGLRCCE